YAGDILEREALEITDQGRKELCPQSRGLKLAELDTNGGNLGLGLGIQLVLNFGVHGLHTVIGRHPNDRLVCRDVELDSSLFWRTLDEPSFAVVDIRILDVRNQLAAVLDLLGNPFVLRRLLNVFPEYLPDPFHGQCCRQRHRSELLLSTGMLTLLQ